MNGADVLVNTYWVRFDRARLRSRARWKIRVPCCGPLGLPVSAGLCTSASTNPSLDSYLPYFSGKAANEQSVMASGMSYSILRPTLISVREDVLINNIAWLLRRFPFFAQIGDGRYKLQPVFVDDLAEIAASRSMKARIPFSTLPVRRPYPSTNWSA